MLKSVLNRSSVLACLADCPADNHARQLAQFLYETLGFILKTDKKKHMTSKAYFNLAGIFLIIFIATYFGDYVGLPIWIHRIATVLLAIFAGLGLYQKKKEEKRP